MDTTTWELLAADDKTFPVSERVVEKWKTVTDMIEILSDGPDKEINLPTVNSWELNKIILWSQHNLHQIPPPNKRDKSVQLTHIDKMHFEKLKLKELARIINAANYLAIDRLIDVSTQLLADKIHSLDPDEIRRELNLINDLPEEDENRLRQEYELIANEL